MKKILMLCIMSFGVMVLTGCGDQVEVPPAHVGKVMGKHGYKVGIIPTSKFRLDPCWAYCDRLITLDVSDQPAKESMTLFMPKDKLNMAFDIRLTLAVSPDNYEQLFNKIPPQNDNIPISTIYNTYAAQIIRSDAREYLSQFTIADIAANREAINTELAAKLSATVKSRTPFIVKYAGLAQVEYPPIITTAQEKAAERREAIQQEEAQLEISKVQLKRQLQEQQMQRKIDVEKASAEAEVNKILAQAVTPQYIKYRELEIADKLATSTNKAWIPSRMLDSVAGQVMMGNQTSR